MGISISKASENDAGFLAKMILQSSRAEKKYGIYDLVFNTKTDEDLLSYLEKLIVTETKNHCHFSNFLIANIDSKQVGTLCSYEPRISTHAAFKKSLEEIGFDGDISEYEEILEVCDFEQNNRTLVFDFMEELEGFVDVGILKALMQKSLLTARLKGYRIAQTIVEIGSLEIILLYKKLGFKEVKQKECELYKEKFGRLGLALLEIEF
ncbi:acyl-CoA acyltransferase [Sulfurimonas sp.]|uniref:acyl-CoA acyltransferase n=1 Tax=Sulfurimonas sp. TaxID=2022749 RepID=UPI0035648A05